MSDSLPARDEPAASILQTVLLIGPEASGPYASGRLFTRDGIRLLRAATVATALVSLRQQVVSLVVLEPAAAGEQGERCRRVRSDRNGRTVPLLCLGVTQPAGLLVTGETTLPAHIDYLPPAADPAAIENRIALLLQQEMDTHRHARTFAAAEERRAWYETIISAVGQGIIGLSSEGAIGFANPAALAMLGMNEPEVVGQRFHLFYSVQGQTDSVWQYTPFFHCRLTGCEQRTDDSFFRRAGDIRFPVAFRCMPMPNKADGLVVVFEDLSVRRQLEARLRRQAILDPLTGLSNREGFKRTFAEAIARAQVTSTGVALLSIDLDRFSRINDTLGHDTGDVLLQAVGRRLQECVGEYDLVARLGGDEFAIVLADLDRRGHDLEIADTVLAALHCPFPMPDGLDITIGASIGIAGFPDSGAEVDAVMRCAEIAMHQAKTDGRNQALVYTADMNDRATGRMAFEQALRVAVDERSFRLHYQPQIDLANGALVGFEALLRWQHQDIGNVSPSRFVPMLEETGLIVPVGRWVFESGCRQRQCWADRLPDECTVSINLSPRQFTDKRLVPQIRHILEVNELPAYRLEIELTESMLMLDREYTHGVLKALKDMGLKLSVDDFGTGYSSLAYLKLFALDALKIDKQFIDDLTVSRRDAAIATSIIQLAHNLGLQVVAEGVETLPQVQLLRELGCDIVQGYYFGKPMPVDDVAAFPHRMQMH